MTDHSAPATVYLYGWPLGHSISPAFQNAAFAAQGLPIRYQALGVPPPDFPAAVAALRADRAALGANCTVPYKETLIDLVDVLSPVARRVGAVNTLVRRVNGDGLVTLVGDNSDVPGLTRALADVGMRLRGARVLVLGAGGAARAAVWTLIAGGAAEVAVYNRTRDRAEALLAAARAGRTHSGAFSILEVLDADGARRRAAEVDLVLSTSSAGLDGHTLPLDGLLVRPGSLWYDMIYNPVMTPFLEMGQRGGARTANGLGMLVHQGAVSYTLWTGQLAPLAVMKAAADEALARRRAAPASRPRVVSLVGQSGSGKSTVAHLLAELWGGHAADSDAMIVTATGQPIAELFRSDGEDRFRARESQALTLILSHASDTPTIVATGGGMVLSESNRAALRAAGPVVWLRSSVETLVQRLDATGEAPLRPLLAGDLADRLRAQATQRQSLYATAATVTVDTDGLTPAEVVAAIESALTSSASESRPSDDAVVTYPAQPLAYPVWMGWGRSTALGNAVRALRPHGRAFIIADAPVAALYGDDVQSSLLTAGVQSQLCAVPAGEEEKSLMRVSVLYDWLAEQRAERRDVIVALGGGRTGDLAGFVAASYLRGMGVIQMPTTLLALIDSSLGGKVGVDLPAGKNLVGAFHQPLLVLGDLDYLHSLPARELRAGLAEVIKHAMIADAELLALLESDLDDVLALHPHLLERVVRQAAQVKIDVVQEDPLEMGRRAILNYGHSIGHALERAAHYQGILHGEAVALGMSAAAHLSVACGLLDAAVAHRQDALLRRAGLLQHVPPLSPAAVLAGLGTDKKIERGRLRWVLLEAVGQPLITADVPVELVEQTVRHLLTVGPHWAETAE